jgi:hypothetical protein
MNQISQHHREAAMTSAESDRGKAIHFVPAGRLGTAITLFLTLLLPVVSPSGSLAMEPVSGRYLSFYGTTVTLEIQVLYPPPASLIVEQHFPPGLEIVSARPIPQKYSSKLGKTKWFFKGIQPGSHTISLEFDQPVMSADIQAVLRYRYPGRGQFIETLIVP